MAVWIDEDPIHPVSALSSSSFLGLQDQGDKTKTFYDESSRTLCSSFAAGGPSGSRGRRGSRGQHGK